MEPLAEGLSLLTSVKADGIDGQLDDRKNLGWLGHAPCLWGTRLN